MNRKAQAEARQRDLEAAASNYAAKLSSVIRKRVRDQVEAEDVFQDVMAEYINAYDLGTVIENIGAWLVRTAQNKILDRFRRRKVQERHQKEVLETEEEPAVRSDRPDEAISRNLLRDEILEALEMLPLEQRDAFVKHELEGKTFEEISAETGVGVNTLLARKRYAVLFLRDRLKEIYDELE